MIYLDCVCKKLTNSAGVGNCDWGWCYVHQPSSCRDLEDSGVMEGEKLSHRACGIKVICYKYKFCLLYTSDAADE